MVVPDRLSIDRDSRYYDPELGKRISVFLDDKRRPGDVLEYCISEGWIRVRVVHRTGYGRWIRTRQHEITLRGVVRVELK